jgi:hypothetical protein
MCGKLFYKIRSDNDSFPIATNSLDMPLDKTNQFHEFFAEKPSWYDISDVAKQIEGHSMLT